MERTNLEQQTARLKALVEPLLAAMNLELLEFQFVPHKFRSQVRITIDRLDRNVSVDDCQLASRSISRTLDLEDPIAGSFNLEVSSPGFKRLLRVPKDLPRFIDHRIRVALAQPQDGRKVWIGVLTSVSDSLVLSKTEIGDLTIPLGLIAHAHLDE